MIFLCLASGAIPASQPPSINQQSGQSQYPNGGVYYPNQMYPQQPIPPMHQGRPPSANVQDHNSLTPQRPSYPSASQYTIPTEVNQESPYRVHNEQQPMHYPSTQNTNNNHMLSQAPHPPFNSPKLNNPLAPGSPLVGGHGRNGPWPNNGQFHGTIYQQNTPDNMQSPGSFGENQSLTSSVDSDATAPPQSTPNKRSFPCPKCSKVSWVQLYHSVDEMYDGCSKIVCACPDMAQKKTKLPKKLCVPAQLKLKVF